MYLKSARFFATLGPIGYLPAPGTCATYIGLLFLLLLGQFDVSLSVYAGVCLLFFVLGFYAIKKTMHTFTSSDPSEIVIDEFVGCIITFFAIPVAWTSIVLGFGLFRLFDITKIAGVRSFERFGGAWGIMLDDIWAGVLSNLILRIVLKIFS